MTSPTSTVSPISADGEPLPTAKPPVGSGILPALGVVWAVLLISAGIVGIRDALFYAGAIDGSAWVEQAATNLDGATAQAWMVPAGVALVLLGLVFLVIGLRPRPVTGIPVHAESGVFLTHGSVRRMVTAVTAGVDGVDQTDVKAGTRTIKVQATTYTHDTPRTEEEIVAAIQERLDALHRPPKLKVRVRRTEALT